MNRVVVDNRVRVYGRLPESVRSALESEFAHRNPKHASTKAMGYSTRGVPEVIRTWREERDHLSLPRGGFGRVRDALRAGSVPFRVEDARQRGAELRPGDVPDSLQEPWPFQRAVVESMRVRENCLMRAPTGSGKTSVATLLLSVLKRPSIVVVWNKGLVDQWRERLVKELGIRERDVGAVYGGRWRLKPVTVAMQQSLAAREELPPEMLSYFGVVLCDEVQRAASDTLYAVVDQFPARYRFGISADERRKDKMEFLTRDLFGEAVADIDRDRLVREGFILDVEVHAHPTEFDAPWYGHPSDGGELDEHRLLEEMTTDHERNDLVADLALRELEAGESVLVMSRRVEHCRLLARMLVQRGVSVGMLLGGAENAVEYRRAVAGLRDGTVRAGVGTYQAVGTGIDIPMLGAGVCATPIASNKQFFNQVRGRFCRVAVGKRGARLHYPWDWRVVRGHLDNLRKWNSTVIAHVDGRELRVDSRASVREVSRLLAGGIG